MRRKIVAGNWKLHGTRAFATGLIAELSAGLPLPGVEVVVLPPMPYLGDLIEDFERQDISFGAQDVSSNEKGAYTGEVSAAMLVDVGARYGLVGHSERRQYHAESSELVGDDPIQDLDGVVRMPAEGVEGPQLELLALISRDDDQLGHANPERFRWYAGRGVGVKLPPHAASTPGEIRPAPFVLKATRSG